MPRRPRSYHPGIPVHVVQRGVNRQQCFFSDDDRELYVRTLARMCDRYRVALHAYALMTNHVHLLLTPDHEEGVSRVMQGLGRVYVQTVNQRVGRTGTLWEGRHRDSLIDSDRYLLACHRYIEMNPVRAGMVDAPMEYPWSSHLTNRTGAPTAPLTPHVTYLGLGTSRTSRADAYARLFETETDAAEEGLREGMRRGYPVGSGPFLRELERLGIPIAPEDRDPEAAETEA